MVLISTSKLLFTKKSHWFVSPYETQGCDAAFFYAVSECLEPEGFQRSESPTFLVDLTQDEDTLLKNMSKSCRYEVKRASREGLEVRKNTDQQGFLDIYTDFVASKGFDGDLDMYWQYVEQGALYTCYRDGDLIAGLLTLQDEAHSRWILSGSRRLASEDKETAMIAGLANRLLVWEAIRDARNEGKLVFDLGGYFNGDDESHPEFRIARFKRGFGGEPVVQYKYSKTYSAPLKLAKSIKSRLRSR